MRSSVPMRFLLTGARLATAGLAAKAAIALTVVLALVFAGKGAQIAHSGDLTALRPLLETTAAALLWGPGVLFAFPTALRAFVQDARTGVRALVVLRGGSEASYLVYRIGGLASAMALSLGSAALFVGAACAWAARDGDVLGGTLAAAAAAFVHVTFGSVLVATVAFAAVGARTRAGGYLRFLAWLVFPGFALALVGAPPALREIGSIDEVLATLRGALARPAWSEVARGCRSFVAALGWTLLAWTLARHEARRARVEAEAT